MSFLTDEIVAASSGNFVVGDDLTVNGNATITLNTVIDDNLTVTNGTVFAGSNVNVTGNVHASNFKAGSTTIGTVAMSATVGSFGIYGGAAQNISAFSGGGQASGTNMGTAMDFTVNVCAADYDSIKLSPTGTSGYRFTVRNATSKICRVYPQVGGSIDGVANGYYDLMPGEIQVFRSGLTANAFMSVLNTLQKNVNALGTITHTGTGYGFVHNTGLWEGLRFPAQGINPAGSTAPPDVSTATGMLMFGASTNEIISGFAHMPHGWKSGTNVDPHVHIMANAATNPRAAATVTAADGVAKVATNYFTSATGGFTGHANEWLAITVTGTNTQAVVDSYQIQTVVSDTNVLLTSNPTNGADDDTVTWAIYPDTVALKFEYAVSDVGETWDQATYTNSIIYHQLSAHDGNAVHEIANAFADINMSGKQDRAMIIWRFTRLGNSAGDTYGDDLHLMELDFHYRHATLGSLAEYGENY